MPAQYIVTQTILYLYLEVEKRTWERVANRWSEQEGLIIAGAWKAAEAGGVGDADG